jgi:biopolymer transport protein ExbD
MQFYKRQRRTPAVIIVSLIDIFAILLIFVIVTTTFKRVQPSVVIKLPESANAAAGASQGSSPTALLTIAADESIYLNNTRLTPETLEPELRKQAAAGVRVTLNADKQAPFGVVLRVMEALKQAGLGGNVSAYTEPLKTNNPPTNQPAN